MTGSDRIIRAGDERLIVSPKTLLVDDEPDLVATCVRLLGQIGHRCLTAGTGREAMGLIDAEHPDLVVTDLRLPTIDGLAIARHARQASPPPVVILTTGFTSREGKREAERAGATLYLPKPFSATEFLDAVRWALTARGQP